MWSPLRLKTSPALYTEKKCTLSLNLTPSRDAKFILSFTISNVFFFALSYLYLVIPMHWNVTNNNTYEPRHPPLGNLISSSVQLVFFFRSSLNLQPNLWSSRSFCSFPGLFRSTRKHSCRLQKRCIEASFCTWDLRRQRTQKAKYHCAPRLKIVRFIHPIYWFFLKSSFKKKNVSSRDSFWSTNFLQGQKE